MESKSKTILDVARLAGVSKGTVDRVLHNRGEVSAKSAAKVRAAIEQLNYEPNLYASLLASRRERAIACVMPRYTPGEYWEKIHLGAMAGSEDVSSMGIRITEYYYDQYNLASFRNACNEVLEAAPAGVILPPLFKTETMSFVRQLKDRNIPYVYVDTRIEDENYLAYIGMPMYKSGYLCASLLTQRFSREEVGKIAVIRIRRDKTGQSDPTASRREGFMDYISENYPDCEVDQVFITPSDEEGTYSTLKEYFSLNPDVRHIVMFNSRVHLISRFLRDHRDEGRTVVGFDDLEKNIEMLKDGVLSILIAQHTEKQSRDAVNILSDHIMVHKDPANCDNYVHMDILTALNIENY